MRKLIASRNELFRGELIEKPKLASWVDRGTERLIRCPHCKHIEDVEACDVGGAEPGCVFCLNCNREMEMP